MSHYKPHIRPKAAAAGREGVVTDHRPAHDVPVDPGHDPPAEPEHDPPPDPDPDRRNGTRVVLNEGNLPG
jgi:hypothetical protein